jgi:tetratricopeptide (TPR) repeat protein
LFTQFYDEGSPEFSELLADFLQNLGHNTLAIHLFSKYLRLRNKNRKGAYLLHQLIDDFAHKGIFLAHTAYQIQHGLKKVDINQVLSQLYDHAQLSLEEHQLLTWFSVLPAEEIAYAVLWDLFQPEEEPIFEKQLNDLHEKGWLTVGEDEHGATYKISPVVQEITRRKHEELLSDCEPLISRLNHKLETEPGTGHFLYCTYEEARSLSRYGEYLVQVIDQANYSLCVLYSRLGSTHTTLGNLSQALGYFEQFTQLMKELYDLYPDNVSFKNGLAISYEKLGETHSSLGNLSQALGYFEERSRLGKELYDLYPDNVSFKNGLAISYEKLGETHSSLGNLSQALGYYEKDAQLSKELYDLYPDNVSFKNGLAISYSKLGSTHGSLGNLSQALGYFEDETTLFEQLYDLYPDNVSFKNGLAISYEKLGSTHSSLGNLSQALGYYEQFTQLMKELYDLYPDNVSFTELISLHKS